MGYHTTRCIPFTATVPVLHGLAPLPGSIVLMVIPVKSLPAVPNDTSSIPDNNVTDIFGLPGNRMWIASLGSVSVYDPVTEKFDRHFQHYLQKLQLPPSRIVYSVQDKSGNYWFLFEKEGLYKYAPREQKATRFVAAGKPSAGTGINSIAPGEAGMLWIVYSNGYLLQIDVNTMKPVTASSLLPGMLKMTN